mgnify:CR=1 FL=1
MSDKERTREMALAALAAGLFAALPLIAHAHSDAEDGHPHGGINGKCVGGNSCKGQSACKTASSQCAGQNACKAQGFTITTEKDCEDRGGTFEES